MTLPKGDKRFTFGLIVDVAKVLVDHGYPVPSEDSGDFARIDARILDDIWGLLYDKTDLGTCPPLPTPSPTRPASAQPELDPPARGVGL